VEDGLQPVLAVVTHRHPAALVAKVQVLAEAIDELDRQVSVDSSIVRAHQHAAGALRTTESHAGRERILRRAERARVIVPSAGPAAGAPPRSTWPVTVTDDRCRSC
jgi:hypothetical protein